MEPIPDADMIFPVVFNGMEYQVHVRTRPFLTQFLERVCRKFEVIVFTASQKVYANELLDRIDPGTFYGFDFLVAVFGFLETWTLILTILFSKSFQKC